MSIPNDVIEDVRWVRTELTKRGHKDDDIISVLDGILRRGELNTANPTPPLDMPSISASWRIFDMEINMFDDALTELIFAESYSDNFVLGDEIPVKTPLKEKRQNEVESITTEEDSTINAVAIDDAIKAESSELSMPMPMESMPMESGNFHQNSLERSKQELNDRYSTCKVVQLKSLCEQENLSKLGRKQELINRLVDQSLKNQYGSPRMRNSYQTAMSSPLAPPDDRPTSAMSHSSLKSTCSTTSIKSERTPAKKVGSHSRFRSPSPNQETVLPRTPSFRSKLTSRIQNSIQSPRLWSKTPSSSSLSAKHNTPSKAELEAKVTLPNISIA